jgi:altronate dehydratase large subunit
MVAGGAQLVLFTTGQGNPYGSAVAPTLKLTANPQTAIRLPHQIDFDGSDVFVGARSRQQALPDLSQLMIATCNGMETAAERLQECAEVISRLGPSI